MNARPTLSFYSFDSLGNPWVSGGGALRDFEILKRFARHADVTLHVARYPGFRDGTREGVKVRGLGFGGRNWLCRLTYTLSANLHVLFGRATISGTSPSIYAPLLLGMLRKNHYIVFHHYVGKSSFRKYGVLGAIPFVCEQLLLRLGRRYLAVNSALAARLRRANPRADIHPTANGFDAALLDLPAAPAREPYVLFIGRFDVYMKGLDLLVPAWAQTLAPAGVDLVLAGRAIGTDLDKVNALIAAIPDESAQSPGFARGRVRLELNITEARKSELLAGCLFFASPSRFEGFGIAALEANAAGRAVLATDNDGFRDSLALGETALAVPVEDQAALGKGLRRLYADGDLRESLGRRGRDRARAFSWDAIAEKEWRWISRNPCRPAA